MAPTGLGVGIWILSSNASSKRPPTSGTPNHLVNGRNGRFRGKKSSDKSTGHLRAPSWALKCAAWSWEASGDAGLCCQSLVARFPLVSPLFCVFSPLFARFDFTHLPSRMPAAGTGRFGWTRSHYNFANRCRHLGPDGEPCPKQFTNSSNTQNMGDHILKCHPEAAGKPALGP
jgi:hypothetical protein